MQKKLLSLFLLYPFFSFCQIDTVPTVKQYDPTALTVNLRADYYLNKGSYFYAENSEAYQNMPESKVAYSGLLGFQYRMASKWYTGISEKYLSDVYQEKSFLTELNFLHTGKIGSINFIQGASYNYTDYIPKKGAGGTTVNLQELGFAAAFSKSIKLGNKSLYLMLSYRAFKMIGTSLQNQRFIYETRLRGDIYYFLKENFYVGVYTIRDTEYLNLSGSIVNYKLNKVTPVVGILANYIFNFKKAENFLPNMPFH